MAVNRNLLPDAVDDFRGSERSPTPEILAILGARIRERAYFASLESKTPQSAWLEAERIEFENLRQELQELAYCFWLEECHRVGGEVHGNDLFHWFTAESQWVRLFRSRCILESVEETMAAKTKAQSSAEVSSKSSCALPKTRLQGDSLQSRKPEKELPAGSDLSQRNGDSMIMEREPDSGFDYNEDELQPEAEVVHCEMVDLSAPEYRDKLIVTDDAQTTVVFAADTLEEINHELAKTTFQAQFKKRFGEHAEFVIHCSRAISAPQR